MAYPPQPSAGSPSSRRTTISLLLSAFLIVFITLSFTQTYSARGAPAPIPVKTNNHASQTSKYLTTNRNDEIQWERKTAYGCSCACSCPTSDSKSLGGSESGEKQQSRKTEDVVRPLDVDDDKEPSEVPRAEFWTILGVIGVLVCLGGIFAGLTIGLMSLDETNLSILKASGTPTEQAYAARIEPIRKKAHLLLVTLLLGNTVVNETLPVLMHEIHLEGAWAVVISTALIVVFGEIIPQAVCARHGLAVGAIFAWPVRIMMWIMFPIAWPIAKLLDFALGHKEGMIYRRAELKELVALHGEDQAGPLTKDEVSIVRAVLDLRDKTVQDVMTPLEHVFMLPLETELNRTTIEQIERAGHSRVPVYNTSRNNIVGVVLIKQLVVYDPDDNVPLTQIKIRRLPRVTSTMPLFDILHVFEQGGSHMAIVVDEADSNDVEGAGGSVAGGSVNGDVETFKPLGVVTLEDVIEELLGQEIIDETDVFVDVATQAKVPRKVPLIAAPPLMRKVKSTPGTPTVEGSEREPLLSSNGQGYGGVVDNVATGGTGGGTAGCPTPVTPTTVKPKPKRKKTRGEFVPAGELAQDASADVWRGGRPGGGGAEPKA
ncbi:hypothetical protein HK097_000295 [Rhizophlyctis rosea]|uniref:DUF21-domain-containing protein n=1 Tax=Rhizophlyctis rosea TaxID=64517 RepID=A0AAD5X4N5_9FUNG|nr:hypothetical protein HK097_000295 [Rhizophlyctis rosea]